MEQSLLLSHHHDIDLQGFSLLVLVYDFASHEIKNNNVQLMVSGKAMLVFSDNKDFVCITLKSNPKLLGDEHYANLEMTLFHTSSDDDYLALARQFPNSLILRHPEPSISLQCSRKIYIFKEVSSPTRDIVGSFICFQGGMRLSISVNHDDDVISIYYERDGLLNGWIDNYLSD